MLENACHLVKVQFGKKKREIKQNTYTIYIFFIIKITKGVRHTPLRNKQKQHF